MEDTGLKDRLTDFARERYDMGQSRFEAYCGLPTGTINKIGKGITTVSLAKKIGVSPTILSKMRSGRLHLGKKIDRIVKAYPYVNRSWLETGDGYPGDLNVEITRERFLRVCRLKDETIETLRKELELNQKVIERLLKK